ncbi:hypothetical protein HK097_005738, partial [Rhizophlyctis rosea]
MALTFLNSPHQHLLTLSNPTSLDRLLIHHGLHQHPIPPTTPDIQIFEALSNNLPTSLPFLRTLIHTHGFVPLAHQTPCWVFRLCQIAELDPPLFATILWKCRGGGWEGDEWKSVNDTVLRRVFSSTHSERMEQTLISYLNRGFILTDDVILSQLRDTTSPTTLQILSSHIPQPKLHNLTLKTLMKTFGPSAPFSRLTAQTLITTFSIPPETISKCLLLPPQTRTPYRTRCYEKEDPVVVWDWVVSFYGPTHDFSRRAFGDLLCWCLDRGSSMWKRNSNSQIVRNVWGFVGGFLERGCEVLPEHMEVVRRMCEEGGEKG